MAEDLLSRFVPAREWLEATFLMIIVYLVLSNATGFTRIINASAAAYTGSVKALQGR